MPGDAFAEIVAQEHMAIEMSVPETDLGLVKPGANTALKLNAFPNCDVSRRGGPAGRPTHAEAGDQYFLVRSTFENTGVRARSGMVGPGSCVRGRWMVRQRLVSGGVCDFAAAVSLGLGESLGAVTLKHHALMHRRTSLLAMAAVTLCVAIGLAGCGDSGSRSEAAAPASAPKPAATPAPAIAAPGAPANNSVLSVLTVEHQVDVTAQRDGVVIGMMKDEGSSVSAGQEVAESWTSGPCRRNSSRRATICRWTKTTANTRKPS